MDSGKYVFIDVRPRARHEEGTIAGAVSVPLYQKVQDPLPPPSYLPFKQIKDARQLAPGKTRCAEVVLFGTWILLVFCEVEYTPSPVTPPVRDLCLLVANCMDSRSSKLHGGALPCKGHSPLRDHASQ